jgi:hypothetical protein
MLRRFEGLSTWTFRIAAISVLALAAHQIIREQSRPAKVDLQDEKYLERMEDYLRREHACLAAMEARQRAYQSRQGAFKGWPRR